MTDPSAPMHLAIAFVFARRFAVNGHRDAHIASSLGVNRSSVQRWLDGDLDGPPGKISWDRCAELLGATGSGVLREAADVARLYGDEKTLAGELKMLRSARLPH